MTGYRGLCAVAVVASVALAAACHRPSSGHDVSSVEDEAAVRELMRVSVEAFNTGNLDQALSVLADDLMVIRGGAPEMSGVEANGQMYAALMAQFAIEIADDIAEVRIANDLAYVRGSYTMTLRDKATDDVMLGMPERYVRILRRQPDGRWKLWRIMTNTSEPA